MQNHNDRFNHILTTLQEKLLTGKWSPGERLPTLSTMANEFQVSVATIREALRVLQSQGLISIEQGRGTFVSKNIETRNPPKLSVMNLMQLIEVRYQIEPALAEIAAIQAFDKEITAISDSTERMRELALNNKSTVEEDLKFHRLIVRATHNEIWIEIYDNLQQKLRIGRNHTNIPGMIEKAVHYHRMIAKSIKDRDPQKAKVYMESHMEGNRELALYRLKDINAL